MSAIPSPPSPDDPLARAAAALRGAPVPDGPPDATIARTLAALRTAAAGPDVTPRSRRTTMIAALKIAAAALVAVGGLSYFVGSPPVGAPAAFAAVAQKLRDARTLAYRLTVRPPGRKDPMTLRYFIKEPGLVRAEAEPPAGPVTVMDLPHGKLLVLNAAAKTAVLMEGKLFQAQPGAPADFAAGMTERLRALAGKPGEPAGKEAIGGVEAQGFRVKEPGQELLVWVDPRTRLPLRIEVTTRLAGQEVRGTLSEIALDPPLDDALFRLEPPAGYTLQKLPASLQFGTPEDALVRLLRAFAEKSGGTFPQRLDDFEAYGKVFQDEPKAKGGPDPKLIQFVQDTVRVTLFLRERKGYGYKPEGVKLGDADAILFWSRPEGSEKYRAVFGDLHVAEVTADRLPAPPKP